MKKQRAMLSLVLSLVLLCSFVMPSLAASYQNGSTCLLYTSRILMRCILFLDTAGIGKGKEEPWGFVCNRKGTS